MNIREMTSADIDFAFACTRAEGWKSETKEEFNGFLNYDPEGCFLAELQSERIGICVATAYKENGFIGELIVIKEKRGQGYGTLLVDHAVRYLLTKGVKNIYLDGDLAAVPLYERAGFRKIDKSLRFTGKLAGRKHISVGNLKREDINTICKIDSALFGDDRSFFLKRRFAMFPELCFVQKIDNQIKGYIMARPGFDVISVGPWVMLENGENPEALLASLSLEIGERTLRIGILESNKYAVGIIKSLATFEEKEYCWRMVLGPQENLGMDHHLLGIGSAAKG